MKREAKAQQKLRSGSVTPSKQNTVLSPSTSKVKDLNKSPMQKSKKEDHAALNATMDSIDDEVKKVLNQSTGSAKLNLPKIPSTYSTEILQPKKVATIYSIFIGETVKELKQT